MKNFKIAGLFLLGTAALFAFGALVHSSAFMAGEASGDKSGYERGFRAGQENEGLTNEKLVKRLEKIFPVSDERKAKDYWEVRFIEEKVLFFSIFSTPPLMNELGIDRPFHYIYDTDGVYAFPTEDFELDDILKLVGPQKNESFQKL